MNVERRRELLPDRAGRQRRRRPRISRIALDDRDGPVEIGIARKMPRDGRPNRATATDHDIDSRWRHYPLSPGRSFAPRKTMKATVEHRALATIRDAIEDDPTVAASMTMRSDLLIALKKRVETWKVTPGSSGAEAGDNATSIERTASLPLQQVLSRHARESCGSCRHPGQPADQQGSLITASAPRGARPRGCRCHKGARSRCRRVPAPDRHPRHARWRRRRGSGAMPRVVRRHRVPSPV